MKNNKSVANWLFKPFTYIAGGKALIAGLVVIAVISVLGYLSGTHFDGVLDIHTGCFGESAPYWKHALFQASTWLILTTVFYITARIVTKSETRLIDIAGTMALSQAPLLFAALLGFIPSLHICLGNMDALTIEEMMSILKDNMGTLIIISVVYIIFTIWSVILKYNAYSVSVNVKGVIGISTFIAALLVAEIISKIFLYIVL